MYPPVLDASRRRRLTYAGAASVGLGLLDLFLLAMPFVYIPYLISLSGYDLLVGQYTRSGLAQGLGLSYPIIWLCVGGGVLAVIAGVDALFPYAGHRQPNYWNFVDIIGISGITLIAGAGILLYQLWSVYAIMWAPAFEPIVGLGLVTAAWSK